MDESKCSCCLDKIHKMINNESSIHTKAYVTVFSKHLRSVCRISDLESEVNASLSYFESNDQKEGSAYRKM